MVLRFAPQIPPGGKKKTMIRSIQIHTFSQNSARYVAFLTLCLCSFTAFSQVDFEANWPDNSWTLDGSYENIGLIGDPTSDPYFGFYSNIAGFGVSNDIEARSPFYDIDGVLSGNEDLFVEFRYKFSGDNSEVLYLEYWDADASLWVLWEDLSSNDDNGGNGLCGNLNIAPHTSIALDAGSLSANQKSNFRFRFWFDDNFNQADAFCISEVHFFSTSPSDPEEFCEPAYWPNTAWTITGSYVSGGGAFTSNPQNTSNFGYNSGLAGFGEDNSIHAESPTYNLDDQLVDHDVVLVDFKYRFSESFNEDLQLEYWDADASAWIFWHEIQENAGISNSNCGNITSTVYTSDPLHLGDMSANQLSNFQYRIAYTDNGNQGHKFCMTDVKLFSGLSSCHDNLACNYDTSEYPGGDCIYPPANDFCAGAIPLTEGINSISNEMVCFTEGYSVPVGSGASNCTGNDGWCASEPSPNVTHDVFYSFTTPETPSTITLEALLGGTLTDTQFAVFDACNGTFIAANDDDGGQFGLSKLVLTCDQLVPNSDYLLLVDGYNGQQGTCDLLLSIIPEDGGVCGCGEIDACNYLPDAAQIYNQVCTYPGCTDPNKCGYDSTAGCEDGSCVEPPANDQCSGAIPIVGSSIVVDNTGACLSAPFDGGVPGGPCFTNVSWCIGYQQEQAGVWYSFTTPPTSSDVSITTSLESGQTLLNTQIAVYDSCDPWPEDGPFAANDDIFPGDLMSQLNLNCSEIAPNTTYYILVDGYDGITGTCTLSVEFTENLSCAGCTNSAACNYNSIALQDDGSCILPDGCTDAAACNYDSTANCDDGTCAYAQWYLPQPVFAGFVAVQACEAPDGYYLADQSCAEQVIENDDYCVETDWDGLCIEAYNCCLGNFGCNMSGACNYEPELCPDNSLCVYPGCTDIAACNYDANAGCDNGNCDYPDPLTFDVIEGETSQCLTFGELATFTVQYGTTGTPLTYGYLVGVISGTVDSFGQVDNLAADPTIELSFSSSYELYYVASNTDLNVQIGDNVLNYLSTPCTVLSEVIQFDLSVGGCMDPTACNYELVYECDNGSCQYLTGCTDSDACNYDSTAECNDGSCAYPETEEEICLVDPNGECGVLWPANLCLAPSVEFPDGHTVSTTLDYDQLNGLQFILWYNSCEVNGSNEFRIEVNGTVVYQDEAEICNCAGSYPFVVDINSSQFTNIPGANEVVLIWEDYVEIAYATVITEFTNNEVLGCTDPAACNYDSAASCDDGSCNTIFGCNDPVACNYNSVATCDDGNCIYASGCDQCSGETDGSGIVMDLPEVGDSCDDLSPFTHDDEYIDCDICQGTPNQGCTDFESCTYDEFALIDDGSCLYVDDCGVCGGSGVSGCADPSACNYDSSADCGDGSCDYASCLGCTDSLACNYDSSATIDDDSCGYPGCIFSSACNYDPDAMCDDDSCLDNFGCTDSAACNYDAQFNCDDGSCSYVSGCSQPLADNYDPTIEDSCDDGSCVYSIPVNDNCANALEVFVGNTVISNISATPDPLYSIPGTDCNDSNNEGWCPEDTEVQAGVFYRFTTPTTAYTSIKFRLINSSLIGNAPLMVDSQIAVYDACNGNLVGANDDSGIAQHGSVDLSCSDLLPNTEYIILVDGKEVDGFVHTGYATLSISTNLGSDLCTYGCMDSSACNYDNGVSVDDGSCEYNSCNSCPEDFDGNGTVNTADLLLFLTSFGESCTVPDCPSDLDMNGEVNTADLLILLTKFGEDCP